MAALADAGIQQHPPSRTGRTPALYSRSDFHSEAVEFCILSEAWFCQASSAPPRYAFADRAVSPQLGRNGKNLGQACSVRVWDFCKEMWKPSPATVRRKQATFRLDCFPSVVLSSYRNTDSVAAPSPCNLLSAGARGLPEVAAPSTGRCRLWLAGLPNSGDSTAFAGARL